MEEGFVIGDTIKYLDEISINYQGKSILNDVEMLSRVNMDKVIKLVIQANTLEVMTKDFDPSCQDTLKNLERELNELYSTK